MSEIEKSLHNAIRKKGTVGAAVAYIKDGQTQFYYFGTTSIQGNTPISKDTIFEIGSISKVFTTLLLMSLASKGEVNIDDPVDNFLHDLSAPKFNTQGMTLRHLASHSSAFPSFPSTFVPKNLKTPYQDYTIEELHYFLQHHSLQAKPGEQFLYSNFGMGLLAYLLCVKTKKNYETLILEHILIPLSMQDTRASRTNVPQAQLSKGHNIRKVVEFWDTPETIVGSAGILSSIRDMTQFLSANLGLICSQPTDLLKICHQQLYKTSVPDEACGLGWIITHSAKGDIIWHDGITGGFRSFIGFNPTINKGLVILTNSREDALTKLSFFLLSS